MVGTATHYIITEIVTLRFYEWPAYIVTIHTIIQAQCSTAHKDCARKTSAS